MAAPRFLTVRDLYDAFPLAESDVGVEGSDTPSLEFLRKAVAEEDWETAVSFCAYLLPRREAVWWGCQSLRKLQPHRAPSDTAALDVAEAWVREPEEPHRLAALNLGSQGDTRSPTTWMALAAGWSGGSIAPAHGMVPAAAGQAARAIRAGLMISMARTPNDQMTRVMKPCLDDGLKLAAGEPA